MTGNQTNLESAIEMGRAPKHTSRCSNPCSGPYQEAWIEPLCIVQDDAIGKMKEMTKMDETYSRAALTIFTWDQVCLCTYLARSKTHAKTQITHPPV
jgi:hypothetical protein